MKDLKNMCRHFLHQYGFNLRAIRENLGLSQLEVAETIGCSQAIISHIECGYMLPPQHIEDALISIYFMQDGDQND